MKHKLREEILAPYIRKSEPMSDYRQFWDMPLSVLQRLIDLGFVEMNSWNECPGVEQGFLHFLKRNPLFTAHGCVGSPDREETRLLVEGIERDASLTMSEVIDFCITFMRQYPADDVQLDADYAYCWYD